MAPPSALRPQDATSDFIRDNVWVPIIGITAATIIFLIIIYCVWRCRNAMRYDYTILKEDLALPQKLEMERKLQHDTMRETALLHCQFYLRSSGLYTPVEHLPEIGSRTGKYWFLVRDVRSKVEKLLTMVPRGPHMVLPFTASTKRTLLGLLHAIQHPYIFPIYDIDLLPEQDRVVVILPYNSKGSLKDVIYHGHCMESWSAKYYMVGTGLTPHLVASYGRQVLEGMLFLQKSGFPPLSHLHSGNVIVQNNTCRLSGYESEFLGLSPKLYGMTTKSLREDKGAAQVISFGHLIYEMAMGNEMEVTIPQSRHLAIVPHESVRQCLEFIFASTPSGFHTLQEICEHPFFKSVPLRELEVFKRPAVKFSKSQKSLLKVVRRGMLHPKKKASMSSGLPAAFPPEPSERKKSTTRTSTEPISRHAFRLPPPLALEVRSGDIKASSSSAQPPVLPKPPVPAAKPSITSNRRSPPPVPAGKPRLPTKPAPARADTPVSMDVGERSALLSEIKKGKKLRSVRPANPKV